MITVALVHLRISNRFRLFQLDFESRQAVELIEFECANPTDIVITDGPDVISPRETIRAISRHAPSSPPVAAPYPSFLLFRLS